MSGITQGTIKVDGVSRAFRVSHDRSLTLKETLVRGGRRIEHTDLWALRDASFTISPGEAVAIVGRNGSGKSTLLKMLAGIIPPHQGSIEVGGRVAALLELGSGFHPDFTGRENVFMNAAIFGLSEREVAERLESIIDFAEMAGFVDMPVRTYSSGMQLRLAFAVSAFLEPDILLLDEVLAVGDEAFQRKCLGRIFDFRKRGGTLVFVSHDATAVERVCDRAILIESGRVVADGLPAEVMALYHRRLASTSGGIGTDAMTTEEAEGNPGGSPPNGDAETADGEDDREEDGSEAGDLPLGGWGTGDVIIESVQLVGESGESDQFISGEPFVIRVTLRINEEFGSPNVGIGVRLTDSLVCFGGNTRLDRVDVKLDAGEWICEYRLDELPLHEGEFEVFVAAVSEDEATVYHWVDSAARFTVFPTSASVGFVASTASWSFTQ